MLSPTYIASRVRALCQEKQVSLRYCNESGSRAWGLESTDSDYDVRFIYQHPKEWYLQLTSPKDMIGPLMELDGELDMAGWDLRKVLYHLAKSNPGVLEWLYSPVTYIKDDAFLAALRALARHYFNPGRVMAHYLGIARSAEQAGYDAADGTWNVKKFCYYLRPILAATYVADHGAMPPVAFAGLLKEVDDNRIHSEVLDLIDRKRTVTEKHREVVAPVVQNYFNARHEEAETRLTDTPRREVDWTAANDFFRQTIGY